MDNLEESVSSIDIKGSGGVEKGSVQNPSNVATTTTSKNPSTYSFKIVQNAMRGSEKTSSSSLHRTSRSAHPISKPPKHVGGMIPSSSYPLPSARNPINHKRGMQDESVLYKLRLTFPVPPANSSNRSSKTIPAKILPKPSATPSTHKQSGTSSTPFTLPQPIKKPKPLSIHTLTPLRQPIPKTMPHKNTRGIAKEAPRSLLAQSFMKKTAEMAKQKEVQSNDNDDNEKKEQNLKKVGNTIEKTEINNAKDDKLTTRRTDHKPKLFGKGAMPHTFTMDPADDGIIFVETTKKKRIRFTCPSLEFHHCLGFAADFSKPSADLTAKPTTRNKYVGTYDEWEDSVVQYIIKTFKKEREIEEEEAELEKRRIRAEKRENKGKRKPAATQKKEKERPFDPLLDRIIETREDGRLRRERKEYRAFLKYVPSRIEQRMPFYRIRCIDGIIKTGDLKRENARIISTRVNPNPNLPYVLSTGVNKNMVLHNYLTGDTVNSHQAHHTYPTDGDWSYCGHYFIACGTDKLVAIIATEMNPCIRTRIYSENIPVGARFTQDRNIAIVAMETGMIDFFDLRDDQKRIVRRITGMPNITCIDTNPLDWSKLAVGCENGMVTEYNFYDDHRKSTTDSYFQYFLPEKKSPIFNMLQFEEYDDFYDSTEVKSLRYCSSADSKLRNDLVVTKANRDKKGDAAYKFSPKRNTAVISYYPPDGMNISCASFAFNHTGEQDIKNGFCKTYIVAGTEEGTVVAFDAETGQVIKGATAVIDDPTHQGSNDWRYEDMDRDGIINSFIPITRIAAHEKNAFDPNLANRITAIDSIPDSHLGGFIVGGWGECPTLNVFRFNHYSHLEKYLHL